MQHTLMAFDGDEFTVVTPDTLGEPMVIEHCNRFFVRRSTRETIFHETTPVNATAVETKVAE